MKNKFFCREINFIYFIIKYNLYLKNFLPSHKVESMMKLTPWTWKLLNSSFKVESPVTVDVALTSHYRLTGNHLTHFSKFIHYNVRMYTVSKYRILVTMSSISYVAKLLTKSRYGVGIYYIFYQTY